MQGMRKALIIAAVVLGTFALLAAAAIGTVMMAVMPFAQSSGPRPSDAAMIAHWRAHRPVLEQLAGMMREDARLKRIGTDWIDPDDGSAGLTPERAARYRKLMGEAKILVVTHYGEQVELVYHTQGMAIRGSGKSFVFRSAAGFRRQNRRRSGRGGRQSARAPTSTAIRSSAPSRATGGCKRMGREDSKAPFPRARGVSQVALAGRPDALWRGRGGGPNSNAKRPLIRLASPVPTLPQGAKRGAVRGNAVFQFPSPPGLL